MQHYLLAHKELILESAKRELQSSNLGPTVKYGGGIHTYVYILTLLKII